MRNRFTLIAALVAVIFTSGNALASNEVMVNGELRPAYREGEVIVKFRDNAIRNLNSMEALYQRLSVLEVRHFSGCFKNFEHLILNSNKRSVDEAVD